MHYLTGSYCDRLTFLCLLPLWNISANYTVEIQVSALFCDFCQATGGQKNISSFFMSKNQLQVNRFCHLFTCLCIVMLILD